MKKVIAVLMLFIALYFVIISKVSYFYGGNFPMYICMAVFSAVLIIFSVLLFFNLKAGKTVYLSAAAAFIILMIIIIKL